MKHGFFASFAAILMKAGLAFGQTQTTPMPGTPLPPSTLPQVVQTVDPSGPIITNDFGGPVAPRFWMSGEYLLWQLKNGRTPPLVTTGDPGSSVPGALGVPGTVVLFGGELDYGSFSGTRLNLGGSLGDSGWDVETSFFFLETRSVGFAAASDAGGNPPLYVPFFNVATGQEGSLTIADPTVGFNFAGNIAVASSSRLWGGELNLMRRLSTSGPLTFTVLGGIRYMNLDESLRLTGEFNDLDFDVRNRFTEGFSTQNNFFGAQVGGKGSYQAGRFNVDVLAKIALGVTHQEVLATGSLTQSGAGAIAPGTFAGGAVFVQPSNLGRRSGDDFSVMPQVQVKVGYDVTPRLRATVAYDFMYWTNVVRPGDQIDRNVNPSQTFGGPLVGTALPASQFNRTDFFAHGLGFGLELRY